MGDETPMIIAHSQCPQRITVSPYLPKFVVVRGNDEALQVWRCEACGAEIIVALADFGVVLQSRK